MRRPVLTRRTRRPFGTQRAPDAGESVGAAGGREEMQRAVHQHDVEAAGTIEVEEVLMQGGDRKRPALRQPPAQFQWRLAAVEHDDIEGMARTGTGDLRQQSGVRRAGDEHVAPAGGDERGQYGLQMRGSVLHAGRRPARQADIGPQGVQLPAAAAKAVGQREAFGGDASEVFMVAGPVSHFMTMNFDPRLHRSNGTAGAATTLEMNSSNLPLGPGGSASTSTGSISTEG